MYCIAKAAISLDGYLDDTSNERRIFSGPEDRAAVDELRSRVDAILIGATTIRTDNPKLQIRSQKWQQHRAAKGLNSQPRRVVLSRSGSLPLDALFFTGGGPLPIVCCPKDIAEKTAKHCGSLAEVVALESTKPIAEQVVQVLSDRGIERMLVEGGSEILTLFLGSKVVSTIRLAVSPIILGNKGRAPIYPALAASSIDMSQAQFSTCGQLAVVEYGPSSSVLSEP